MSSLSDSEQLATNAIQRAYAPNSHVPKYVVYLPAAAATFDPHCYITN